LPFVLVDVDAAAGDELAVLRDVVGAERRDRRQPELARLG
jgi:hypothetical protein